MENIKFNYKYGYQFIVESKKAIIIGYIGSRAKLTIPRQINGHPVTSIGDNAFEGTGISSMEIPYSVEKIGDEAFAYCSKLEKITLPNKKFEKGGRDLFKGCNNLNEILHE